MSLNLNLLYLLLAQAQFWQQRIMKHQNHPDQMDDDPFNNPKQVFKAVQQKYQDEMQDMLDDLSMPNQSMTISNLSQISYSPFRGKTTPSRGVNLLGELANIQSQNNMNQISARSPSDDFDSIEKDTKNLPNLDTINVVSAINHALNFNKRRQSDLDIKDLSTDQDQINKYVKGKRTRDSPDFKGNKSGEEGLAKFEITDDLGTLTARSTNQPVFQMKFDKTVGERSTSDLQQNNIKQNRSFADSVVNEQQKKLYTMKQPGNQPFSTSKDSSDHQADNRKSSPDQEDDISAMSISQCGNILGALDKSVGNVSAISGMYTKRSPYLQRFKNLENEESLHLTPISNKIEAKTTEKDELVSQDGGLTSSMASNNIMKHQQLQKQFLQTIENTASNAQQSQEASKLRVELTLLKTKYQTMQKELQQTQSELTMVQQLNSKENKQNIELQNKISELQDQIKLLQQNLSDNQQLPSYLSRAQENARKEISTLKSQLCDRDQQVAKLQKLVTQNKNEELNQQESLVVEINRLCEELDKEKLLTSSLKKQHEADVNELKSQLEQISSQNKDQLIEMQQKMQEYENYIQSIVKEYQDKELELQTCIKQVQAAELNSDKLKKENTILKQDLNGFKERCSALENEVQIVKGDNKQRQIQDSQMEVELSKLRDLSAKQISQLKQDKSQMREQIEQLTSKLKAVTLDPVQPKLEAEIVELKSVIEKHDLLMSQVITMVGCTEKDNVVQTLHEVMLQAEEHKLLDSEYKALQTSYTSLQHQLKIVQTERDTLSLQVKEKERLLNAQPSNFTKNLLYQKDEEIMQMKGLMNQLKQEIQAREEQVWRLEKEGHDAAENFERSQKQILAGEEKIQQMGQSIKSLESSHKSELTDLKQSLQTKQDEISQLKQHITQLQESTEQSKLDVVNQIQRLKQKNALIQSPNVMSIITIQAITKPQSKHQDVQVNLPNQEVDNQIKRLHAEKDGLSRQLADTVEKSKLNEKQHLELLNTQRITILEFEQQFSKLKNESEQIEYRTHATVATAERARIEQLAKLNKEILAKNNQIEILKLENEQMELEVERIRINEQQLIETVKRLEMGASNNTIKVSSQSQTDSTVKQSKEVQVNLAEEVEHSLNNQVLDPDSSEKDTLIQSLQVEIETLTVRIHEMNQSEAKILEEAEKIAEQFKSREITYMQEKGFIQNQLVDFQEAANLLRQELKQEQQQRQLDIQINEKQLEKIKKEHELVLSEVDQKYQKQLQTIEQSHESGKESVLSQIYADHKIEVEALNQKHNSAKKALDEKVTKLQQDIQKLKDESERSSRMASDKLNKAVIEAQKEREVLELNFKQKMDAQVAKGKKELKAAQDKTKVDVLNATETLKNENAKLKADWERDKKKLISDHEDQLAMQKQLLEEEMQLDKKDFRDKNEQVLKKKLQEKESVWQSKFEEIEAEVKEMNEAHQRELKQERQRIENRLKEQLRSQITIEVKEELENEYQGLKQLASKPSKGVDQVCQTENQMSIDQMHTEVQQIRDQYNQKLKEALGSQNVVRMKNDIIVQMQKALSYEFQKIMLSLKSKQENLSQENLNQKRSDINKQIQNILAFNKDLLLKKALDSIKLNISEVLKLFKQQLEEKSNKKISELDKKLKEATSKLLKQVEVHQVSFMNLNATGNDTNEELPQKYINDQSNLSPSQTVYENNVLERLEPQMTNQNGNVVVEVEKVYKDLYVLYQSLRASKFFRMCITNQNDEVPETLLDITQQLPSDQIVKNYRDLLNYFFKLFVKLNNGVDQLQKQNELYRLKLLNQDLKEQQYMLKQEIEAHFTQEKVNNILNYITNDQLLMNMLSEESLSILSKIQDMSATIEKLLEHQQMLLNLFTVNDTFHVNKNCAEINQYCQQFLHLHGYELLEQQNLNLDLHQNTNMNIVDDTQGEFMEHQQFEEEPYELADQQNHTLNFLSSVQGDQNYNQNNVTQDQAVEILTKVLQKLTHQPKPPQLVHQVLNNTQDHIPMQRALSIDNTKVYASQQYSAHASQEQKNSTIANIFGMVNDAQLKTTDERKFSQENETCIKQAESLLQMFKQSTLTSNFSHQPKKNATSKSFGNMPLQREDRAQSWTKTPTSNQGNTTHYQNTPQNKMNSSQNIKSLDNISNISGGIFSSSNFNQNNPVNKSMQARANSTKFSGGPPIPPLQLKQQSLQQPMNTNQNQAKKQPSVLNTADDYYKQQKLKQLEKKTNSQVQLQRIEKVVSPISNSKHLQTRQDSISSQNRVQVRPQEVVVQNKFNSQFQTVEHDYQKNNQFVKPTLPKSKRPPPGSSFTTITADEDVNQSLNYRKKTLNQSKQRYDGDIMDQSYVNTATDEEEKAIDQTIHPQDLIDNRFAQLQTLHNHQNSISAQLESTGYKNMRMQGVTKSIDSQKQTIQIFESQEITNNKSHEEDFDDDNSSTSTNQHLIKLRNQHSTSQSSIKASRRYQ